MGLGETKAERLARLKLVYQYENLSNLPARWDIIEDVQWLLKELERSQARVADSFAVPFPIAAEASYKRTTTSWKCDACGSWNPLANQECRCGSSRPPG